MGSALAGSEIKTLSRLLHEIFPDAKASYLFGSASRKELRPDSDIEIAVLQDGDLDVAVILHLKSEVSKIFRRNVDVIDLKQANTVTAAEIISSTLVLSSHNPDEQAFFETTAFSKYAILNEERAGILDDIFKTGTIYGRSSSSK